MNHMDFPIGWYAILDIKEIKKNNHPYAIKRFGLDLVLWRNSGGSIRVMLDKCPHRSAKLSMGKIIDDNIECPFHGFKFCATGTCTYAPEFNKAIPKLSSKVFKVHQAFNMIWMYYGNEEIEEFNFEPLEKLENQFTNGYSLITKQWNAHITRCVENQLDYTHLPKVHKSTIGRGFTMPTNPRFISNEKSIMVFRDEHANILEQIQYPRRRQATSPTSSGQKACQQTWDTPVWDLKMNEYIPLFEYIFPNAWILHISSKMKLLVFFVPISDSSTKLYIRTYNNILRNRLLRPLFDIVMRFSNKIILKQDQRIVESQGTLPSYLFQDELLMKHDSAIRLFRKIWLDNMAGQNRHGSKTYTKRV